MIRFHRLLLGVVAIAVLPLAACGASSTPGGASPTTAAPMTVAAAAPMTVATAAPTSVATPSRGTATEIQEHVSGYRFSVATVGDPILRSSVTILRPSSAEPLDAAVDSDFVLITVDVTNDTSGPEMLNAFPSDNRDPTTGGTSFFLVVPLTEQSAFGFTSCDSISRRTHGDYCYVETFVASAKGPATHAYNAGLHDVFQLQPGDTETLTLYSSDGVFPSSAPIKDLRLFGWPATGGHADYPDAVIPIEGSSSQAAAPQTPSQPTAPRGLPEGWSSLAIRAATTALTNCAQANSLTPEGCPQQRVLFGSRVAGVHWTLLNQPLANAVAVAGRAGSVDVWGLYQMEVSYIPRDQGIRPNLNYSGGIAHATMTWDGTSFQKVLFDQSSQPSGAPTVPPFARPGQATDDSVLAAVKAGFQDCVTIKFPPLNPQIPNCPQISTTHLKATSAQYVQNGDPTQGALVSFDTARGNFAVTGSFDMDLTYAVKDNPGAAANGSHTNHVSGNYTATLVWDGSKVQLLNID